MKRALSVACLLAVACSETTVVIDPDATIITILDNAFISNHVQVFPDQQVVWNWTGTNTHNVTFDVPDIEPSPTQDAGQIVRTFTGYSTGQTITYYCSVHGRAVMSGIIAIR